MLGNDRTLWIMNLLLRKLNTLKDICIRCIAFIIPKNKSLIVYGGSWDLFIDNAKHQFLLNNETMVEYRHVWLTKRKDTLDYMQRHGLQSVKSDSLMGLWLLLRAAFIIYDDGINYFANQNLSVGAHRINIWHGVPAKMIGRCRKEEDCVACKKVSRWHELKFPTYGEYLVCTSKSLMTIFSYSMQIPINKILISGYPRTHVFFMGRSELWRYVTRYESDNFQEIYKYISNLKCRKYIYMPTFRDKNKNYLTLAVPDWGRLNKACQEANTVLFVKVHRVTPLPDVSQYSNILIMDNQMDVYPLLPLFDMLITDYSSIMFDFSLMAKKILLYIFDIEQYRTQSRPIFSYFDELLEDISHVDSFDDFVKAMSVNFDDIHQFPSNVFFDSPKDFEQIPNLIRKLS